ncbi:GNAT family N-acetyltransferase [Candidatus Protochlamydia amoebophila]|uniref:GNAT family N-acetyltransferase n=1 Tax=Candidatus Protochlamydia amoebophila TaxID=362787 RepID=UPI0015EF1970|nr:GNAT family N-acetyltransferase [Candidatus Protochlamydia amoebophila]
MPLPDALSDIMNKIEVVEYDPNWPELFEVEAERIKQALGHNCIEIHHIGSTSIPGLSAKPIIDMLPVVRNIQEVDKATKAMESLGYEVKGEYGIAFRRYFQKGKSLRTHNVHVYQEGDPEIIRYLNFRNWMRSHPDDANSYAKLKLELAKKFPYDSLQYCNGKDAFVANIDVKDGFDGWRIVKALTDREWDAVRLLRQKYFFKSKEDPYTWTFTHKDHIHFVFYKNAEIIGYAHLQLWPENRVALRIIVVDEHYRKLGFGSQFLRLCERWLYHQGFKKLLIQSSQEACQFYRRLGYTEMPFNDPDGYKGDPRDFEIGKCLTVDRMDRPKISIYIATSIDGYIARKDGGIDWLDRVGGFDEDYGFQKLMDSIDALIIGRKTYEVAITVPNLYAGKRVVVLSNSLSTVREDMELYCGDLIQLISQLHSAGVKHIWIDGGVTISHFLDLQIVDSMTLSVIPIILGSGIPLFNPIDKEHACRLISSQSYPSGLVQLNYETN